MTVHRVRQHVNHQTIQESSETFNRSTHLDAHFEANLGGCTAQLHMAGIQPGWHVLDAGAGGGNYLPLIAELVGPSGRITALDLSTANVEIMRERLGAWDLACPVGVLEGSILDLPFEGDTFDAVWCANTSQQLSDIERQSLANFWRDIFAAYHVDLAEQAGVSGDELQFSIDLRDDTPNSILNHPDFYSAGGQILAVGHVPEEGRARR